MRPEGDRGVGARHGDLSVRVDDEHARIRTRHARGPRGAHRWRARAACAHERRRRRSPGARAPPRPRRARGAAPPRGRPSRPRAPATSPVPARRRGAARPPRRPRPAWSRCPASTEAAAGRRRPGSRRPCRLALARLEGRRRRVVDQDVEEVLRRVLDVAVDRDRHRRRQELRLVLSAGQVVDREEQKPGVVRVHVEVHRVVAPAHLHGLRERGGAQVVSPGVEEVPARRDAQAGALGLRALAGEREAPEIAARRVHLAVVDERVEVLAEGVDLVVGDPHDAAHVPVCAPRPEADAPVIEDHDGRRSRYGREQHALFDHHPVVPVLGLEGAVEGGRDAAVDRRLAGDAAGSVGARERLGILDARLHLEVELPQIHRHQQDAGVRPVLVGANERLVEGRRRVRGDAGHVPQPGHVRYHPLALRVLGGLPDGRDARRRPVGLFDRRARRVERRRRRVGGGDDVGRVVTGLKGDAPVSVAERQRLVLDPGDRCGPDPRDGAQRIDDPVREALGQVHRCVRVDHRQGRREVAGREVDQRVRCARVAPGPLARIARRRGRSREMSSASAPSSRPTARAGDSNVTSKRPRPVAVAGLLQVREGGHPAVGRRRRLVLRALPGEREHGHALLLPVGTRRERGVVATHDELVIVADGGAGEVVRRSHVDGVAVGGDPHPRAPHVARVLARRAREKQRPAAQNRVGDHSLGRLPADVRRVDARSTRRPSERGCEGPEIAPRRRALHRQARQGRDPGERARDGSPRARPAAEPIDHGRPSTSPRRPGQPQAPRRIVGRVRSLTVRVLLGACHERGARRRQQRQEVVPAHGAEARGPPGRRHGDSGRRDDRHRRPLRRWQVDAPSLHRDARRADRGHDHPGRAKT